MTRLYGEARVKAMAKKIRESGEFRSELAVAYTLLDSIDRKTVIAAVVESGLCDDALVRATRSYPCEGPLTEPPRGRKLEEIEKKHGLRNGRKE